MDEAISRLIESMESIAPHIWAVMVRQARIDAWLSLFWFVACIGIAIAYTHILRRWLRMYQESDEGSFILWDGSIPMILASVIIAVIVLVGIPISLTSMVQGFANPEFAAIRTLLGLVS